MKHASLLIALCVLFSFSAFAQSATTVEKTTKRITITTKKVDENGKTITETYIAEGDEPGKILEGMAIDPKVIHRVDVTNGANEENEEQIFMFRRAGDDAGEKVIIERSINDENGEIEKIIIINKENGNNTKDCYKITPYGNFGHASVWVNGQNNKINCAALGVFVNNHGESKGSVIGSLIENGGAKAAGLKAGDVIVKIEEFDVTDFATLHLALSHFKPGDMVTVRYEREGKNQKAKVELKDWAELPGHEWRSRSDCGQDAVIEEKPVDKIISDNLHGSTDIQPLQLENVTIFPNQTEGIFSFSFKTMPGPIAVSITDVNGKVVYDENNENSDGSYQNEIDLKGLPQGNYIISVTQGDKVFTDQISKQ